jgi:diaminopimelate decarboxylase
MAQRVNPDDSGGGHEKIATGRSGDKFGVGADDAAQLYARACASAHLDPRGLAVHIGSQIHDLAPLRAAFETLRGLAFSLRGQGFSVAQLDLGGGLGAPYFNAPDPPSPADYAAMVESVFAGTDFMLAFEPGRAIAANAGVLISRVIRIQERAGRRILVMDAAMNDLVRPAMYDAYHDLRPVRASADARAPFDIVGPICESGDTFARGRAITPMGPGDLAAFFTAGAYGAVMASAYNARALTPEVLVAGDAFAVVRRRWDVEAQMALENMPDWLSRE